jgi:C1A family cysteine protease/PKD repeat protein
MHKHEKMKKIVVILTGLLIVLPIIAQKKPQYAPLNPEYLRYLEAKKNGTLKSETADGNKLGYIPSPMYLHFKEQHEGSMLKSTTELPAKYDLRTLGLVTPVKNQNGPRGGNCWAFATLGSIESRWLVIGDEEYDLSEQNMVACSGFESGFGEGGNLLMSMAYLTRHSGPILESQNPYNPSVPTCLSNLNPVALVPEAHWVYGDRNLYKQAIMDYGGLFTSVHWDDLSFNETFNTFYYKGNEDVNHAWVVVGWDDLKLVPGASQVGAWIIKNSWAETWAEDGYAYCSYADSKHMDNAVYLPEKWENNEVDTLYMYDLLGPISSTGYSDDVAYGIAKYIAPEEQLVTKVGTFVNSEGSILDIEIYDDFDGNVTSNLLNSKSNIYIEFPGYYTFDLPTIVNGDFYIKIKYYTPGFTFPIGIERFEAEYANPVIDTAVNWISPDGKSWNSCDPDSTNEGVNLTIRAYAVNLISPLALFESSKENVCLESSVTFTFLENDSVTSYDWNFGESASPATANGKGPHQVTYSSLGRKTISLSVNGPNGSDTKVRNDYINVVPGINVIIPESKDKIPVGMPYEITAFGADTYVWTPATYLDKTTGQTVVSTPAVPGDYTYIVTGYQGSCSATDTFTLSAKIRPPNDNVCDAIEIFPGGWLGKYTNGEFYNNRNATKEPNEPAPLEGDCNTPLRWCEEGGVQNSVWFWFTATPRGVVSFNTEGFDEQIAIYRADTCADILDGKGTLIAANDDYYPEEKFFAAALEAVTVEPGQKYFVQIDGSAGGKEGFFSMIFWDYPMGVDVIKESSVLDIYPNPGNGIYHFKTDISSSQPVILEVFNLSGQLLLDRNYGIQTGMFESSFDLKGQSPGIYQVRFIAGEKVIHKKIILQ